MSEQIYKIVKLKMQTDVEQDLGIPASVKVFVANADDECNFNVAWQQNERDNVSLAMFIIEKMTRAYYEGYTDRIDEEELNRVIQK